MAEAGGLCGGPAAAGGRVSGTDRYGSGSRNPEGGGEDAGLYSYLGVLETDGKPVSLYGKRLEAEISMEALCPEEQGAKRCMQAADALVTKLSGGVPGLTISRICAEECRFAADADCYSCKVTAHALAYVYALANEEETEFTDFILKGEVQ